MSSDSERESDIDLVEVPDVPLFDLVSQRLLLVSVPESEKNPQEFMHNVAINELKAEPSSLHVLNIGGAYFCFDESKIADGLFSTQNRIVQDECILTITMMLDSDCSWWD